MRNKKGITLIALVITIIVIIILAAVSINIAVNDNFFGKTEDAKNMNNEAIANAERDEKESLKQNVDGFTVGDKYAVEGIRILHYVPQTKSNLDNTIITDVNNNQIKKLEEIDVGLSQFIDELDKNEDIYFEVTTERTNVAFEMKKSDGSDVTGWKYVEVKDDNVKVDDVYYKNTTVTSSVDPTKIICINSANITDKLNGLQVIVNSVNGSNTKKIYQLEFRETTSENEIKLANGQEHEIKMVENGDSQTISINLRNNVEDGIAPLKTGVNKNVVLSEKTSITNIFQLEERETNEGKKFVNISQYGTIDRKKTTKTSAVISDSKKSNVKTENIGDNITLYLVAEEDIDNEENIVVGEVEEKNKFGTKIIYMDNYPTKFYNPLEELEVYSTNIPFVECNHPIIFRYNSKADVKSNTYGFAGQVSPNPSENYSLNSISRKNEEGKGKITIQNVNNGWDNNTQDSLKKKNYSFRVFAELTDYGGYSLNKEADIYPGKVNFEVYDLNNPDLKEQFIELEINNDDGVESALEFVRDNWNNGKYPNGMVIKQITPTFTVHDKIILNQITLNSLSSLTFDLNGNTLNFANEKQLEIGSGFTFTLISSDEKYDIDANYSNKGMMTFRHDSTFVGESILLHISLEDFKDKYPKFESMETWLKAEGKSTSFLSKIANSWEYNTALLNAYRAYLDSFNYIGWNVDYESKMSGIVNYGDFNFTNGKIRLTTEEKVKAIGVGGGIVANIADNFLKILELFGIESASLSQFTANYAQIDNTGAGIENYGNVILGKEEQYEADGVVGTPDAPGPHPEIQVLVDTTEENISIIPFRRQNPNRAVSNNYGIWNKGNDAKVDMYSGFIRMSSENYCNSWWAIMSLVKSFGIYNEAGTTTIHSVTQKDIFKSEDIWHIQFIEDFAELFRKKLETGYKKDLSKMPKGFFTESELRLVVEIVGGVYYYTRTGAVGMPESWGEKYTTNWTNASEYYTNLFRSPADDQTKDQFYIYDAYDATPGKVDIKINKNIMGAPLSDSFRQNVYQHAMNWFNTTYGMDFETNLSWGYSRLSESVMYTFFKGDWVHQNFDSETIATDLIKSLKRSTTEFNNEYLPVVNQWWNESIVQPLKDFNSKIVTAWEQKVVDPSKRDWKEITGKGEDAFNWKWAD